MRVRRGTYVSLVLLLSVVITASPASAGQKWDIEVHGGTLVSANPTRGATTAPPPSSPVPITPFPSSPTLVPVASWYFGDGAALLSSTVPARIGARIVPLDPLFESRLVERQSGGSFGVRL